MNRRYVVKMTAADFKRRIDTTNRNGQQLYLPVVESDSHDELATRRRLHDPELDLAIDCLFENVVVLNEDPFAIYASFTSSDGQKLWVQIQVGRREISFDVIDF